MIIRLTITLWILFTTLGVFAQHCPFDNLAILVVEVSDSTSMEKIYDLELVLRYENGDPVVLNYGQDTLFFRQNAPATSNEWYPYNFKKIRYEFAEDNYILPLSMDFREKVLFIHIHDSSNTFNDQVVQVESKDYFDIHKNMGMMWYDIQDHISMPATQGTFNHLIKVSLIPKND
jgi:hypothetical protein